MNELTYMALGGKDILPHLEGLAGLRIEIFRDFPYLYEGTLEYEVKYLHKYVRSDRSRVFAVYDGVTMVGASTCIPLIEEADEVKQPFENFHIPKEQIFYFGESILKKDYRGRGIGHYFFDQREQHAKALGGFTMTCFCSVQRPADHSMIPANYRTNDAFWEKRGYTQRKDLVCYMEWPDLQEAQSTQKPLVFWTREL